MRILVVEDTHIVVAREAFLGNTEHTFIFAETYEEALAAIQEGVDAVVTDLFFPSETDWVKFYSGILDPRKLKHPWSNQETRKQNFKEMDENPSGLAVVQKCIEQEIPFVVVTAGNRHHKNLGSVRYALPGISIFAEYAENKDEKGYDPFPDMILGLGHEDPPKDHPETWRIARKAILGGDDAVWQDIDNLKQKVREEKHRL